jgi:hypothetical protein
MRILRCKDGASDEFWDLRNYGISEGSKSVHPLGNPMSHSTHVGFNAPPAAAITAWSNLSFDRFLPFFLVKAAGLEPFAIVADGVGHNPYFAIAPNVGRNAAPELAERLKYAPLSTVTGVGNNPEPVASVRGTNGGSRYAMPLSIVPDLGQVSENTVKPSTKQCCDVLHDDVFGS